MDEVILPFCHIENDYEFLSALWNDRIETTDSNRTKPCDDHIFNPFEHLQDIAPTNWNPSSCRYLTTDELASIGVSKGSLTITQLNIRSLKKNFEHLKSYLNTFNTSPQVIMLSETWLKEEEEKFYELPGYTFISLPRQNKIGGGVAIYISNKLSFKTRADLKTDLTDECEYIAVEVSHSKNNSIILISMYRPPNTDLAKFNLKFNRLLEIISLETRKNIIVAGDFNIDLLKYEQHQNTEQFLNCLHTNTLLPTITRPTRITEYTSTLLDNIFVNCFEHLKYSFIIYDDMSDHLPTVLHIDFDHNLVPIPRSVHKRTYKKENFSDFYNKLKSINWKHYSEICSNNSRASTYSDDTFNEFHSLFYQLFDSSFPAEIAVENTNRISKKKSQPWMTNALIKSCRKKSRLQKCIHVFLMG